MGFSKHPACQIAWNLHEPAVIPMPDALYTGSGGRGWWCQACNTYPVEVADV